MDASVTTVTVVAPAVTTQTTCDGQWAHTRVSWTPSPTARVSAYVVTRYDGRGSEVVVASSAPPATYTDVTMERVLLTDHVITYTVTVRTDYGWTTMSAPTPQVTC